MQYAEGCNWSWGAKWTHQTQQKGGGGAILSVSQEDGRAAKHVTSETLSCRIWRQRGKGQDSSAYLSVVSHYDQLHVLGRSLDVAFMLQWGNKRKWTRNR